MPRDAPVRMVRCWSVMRAIIESWQNRCALLRRQSTLKRDKAVEVQCHAADRMIESQRRRMQPEPIVQRR